MTYIEFKDTYKHQITLSTSSVGGCAWLNCLDGDRHCIPHLNVKQAKLLIKGLQEFVKDEDDSTPLYSENEDDSDESDEEDDRPKVLTADANGNAAWSRLEDEPPSWWQPSKTRKVKITLNFK
jgi:hypothetical protein